jgi:hypothetical protein
MIFLTIFPGMGQGKNFSSLVVLLGWRRKLMRNPALGMPMGNHETL